MKSLKLFFFVLGSWLSTSMLVNFVAVPTVFRNVSSRVEAGDIGIKVFSALNITEVVYALLLLVTAHFFRNSFKSLKLRKVTLGLLVTLFFISLTYQFYMTPQIIEKTQMMRDLDEESREYKEKESQHQFLHATYVKIDSLKLILLLSLVGIGLRGIRERDLIGQEKTI